MRWIKRVLYFIVALILVVAILPFVVPLDFFIPQTEKFVSETIHQPVTIQNLRAVLLPAPGLAMKGVRVGKMGEDTHIETVTIFPDLPSLTEPIKTINRVELNGVVLNQEGLLSLPAWIKPGTSPQQFITKKIRFSKVTLGIREVNLGLLQADINLTPQNAVQDMEISTEDTKLNVVIKPANDQYALTLQAKNWTLPFGPALVFDDLNINAVGSGNNLDMQEIKGVFYGGTIDGAAKLAWQENWQMNGELRTKGIDIAQIIALTSRETSMSGKFNGNGTFSMKAASVARLFDSPNISAKFEAANGVLYNWDLVKAVQASSEGARGGQTRYEEFSGAVQMADKSYQLSQLKITSGLLSANGAVNIAANKQLSGNVRVQLKGSSNLVSVPLVVSGSMKEPLLRPVGRTRPGKAASLSAVESGASTGLGIKTDELAQ